MIRFVSCPKKFSGVSNQLQRRAIGSWKAISEYVHLAGPSEDIQSIPPELEVCSAIICSSNQLSTLPYFSEVLDTVQWVPPTFVCYVNADIILPSSFSGFKVKDGRYFYKDLELPREFLIVGSRWNLGESVEYRGDSDIDSIRKFLIDNYSTGDVTPHDEHAMDYFLFPCGLFDRLAPLIVGRGAYDNALVGFCLSKRIPVIDGSREWPVLHQFHGYAHKPGGREAVYLGEEAVFNRRTHGIEHSVPTALDADFILQRGSLLKSTWRCGFWRRVELFVRFRLGWKVASYLFRAVQRGLGVNRKISENEMRETVKAVIGPGR